MRNIALSLALAAVSLVASPAIATDAKLFWRDLDLGSEAGKVELDRRIDVAARQACAPVAITGTRLGAREPSARCLAEARTFMTEQIAAKTDRSRLAAGNRGTTSPELNR